MQTFCINYIRNWSGFLTPTQGTPDGPDWNDVYDNFHLTWQYLWLALSTDSTAVRRMDLSCLNLTAITFQETNLIAKPAP